MCGCWQSESNSLTLPRRIVYGLGHILNELAAAMWFTYLLVYMHYVVGFSNNMAGYLMLAGQITDAVATPLFGFAMDRTRGLCGYPKRKSWHIIGALSLALCFPFIFMPCLLGNLVGLWGTFSYYMLFVVVVQLGHLSSQISHLSLIPALTPNKAERTELNAIRYGFTVVATIVLYLITWLLLRMTEDSHDVTKEDVPVFRTLALVIVGVGVFFVIIFHLVIKEPDSKTSQVNHPVVDQEKIPACKKASAPSEDKTKQIVEVQVENEKIPGLCEASEPTDREAKVKAMRQRQQDKGQHVKKPSDQQTEPGTKEAPKMTVAEMSVSSAHQVTPSAKSMVKYKERQTTQQAPSKLESQTSIISCSISKDVDSKTCHQHELDDGNNAHDCTLILQSMTGISEIHCLTNTWGTGEIARHDGTDENGVTGARHGMDDDDSVRPVSEDVMTHATVSRMRTEIVSTVTDAAAVSPPVTDDCDILVTRDDVTTVTWRDAKTSKMNSVKTAADSLSNLGKGRDGQPQALCVPDGSNNDHGMRIEDDGLNDPSQAVVGQDVNGKTAIPWKQWFREYQFYQIAVLYMCARLVVNITQVYLPFYLSDSIKMDKKYIAIIPLVLYISGFLSSLIQRPINMYCGKKVTYFCAGLVTLVACVWFSLLHHSHEMLVFGAACLMGLGGSTLLVTSLALITDLIGQYVDSSSFVFGSMTFAEKLVTGVAIFAIQELHPCPADVCCDACVPYYRDILTFVTGVMAVIGIFTLLTLGSAVVGQLRLHKKQ